MRFQIYIFYLIPKMFYLIPKIILHLKSRSYCDCLPCPDLFNNLDLFTHVSRISPDIPSLAGAARQFLPSCFLVLGFETHSKPQLSGLARPPDWLSFLG